MIYFIPRVQLATLAPPQTSLRSKIGGVPWGLPPGRWPTCCHGHLQKLVAQLLHEPPMLDLGNPKAVLHLFQCQICLGISDDDTGRAAFIVDRDELGNEPSMPEGYDEVSELGRPLIGEAFLEGWERHDDGIPESRLSEFFDERKLWALHDEFPNVRWYDSHNSAKFGGSPRWTGNGPMACGGSSEVLRPPFEFLFQLDEAMFIEGKAPEPDDVGCQLFYYDKDGRHHTIPPSPGKEQKNAPLYITYVEGSDGWYFDYINLGTDGSLFVFINRAINPHKVRWFWNR